MTTTIATPETALILSGEGYTLSISKDAKELKASLIEAAQELLAVSTFNDADEARANIKSLAWMRNQLEKSRKAVKEPVIATGKQIDEIAKAFIADVEQEETRLTRLVAAFAAEQERKKREAEAELRRQQDEARRLEAERDRLRAAAAKEHDFLAQVEADKLRDAAHEQRKALIMATQEAPRAVTGTRTVLDFEVTDAAALAAAAPQFVTITPKRAEILAFIKGTPPDMQPLPGIRVFEKTVVGTR